jgi:hypothetical protein
MWEAREVSEGQPIPPPPPKYGRSRTSESDEPTGNIFSAAILKLGHLLGRLYKSFDG